MRMAPDAAMSGGVSRTRAPTIRLRCTPRDPASRRCGLLNLRQASVRLKVVDQFGSYPIVALIEPAFQCVQKRVDGFIAVILCDFSKGFGKCVVAL